MMRISTTTLEAWRLFQIPDQEWMSLADLEQSILGSPTQNRPMLIGIAFEKILASPVLYGVGRCDPVPCDGYLFTGEILPAYAGLPPSPLWQVKTVGQIAGHDIVAKADCLHGADIYELKTTGSSFDIARYLDAYQWRFMAVLFGAPVHYRVWPYTEKDLTVTVKPCEAFTCYPYVGMEADCARLVRTFAEFVIAKGWDAELNRRQQVFT